MTIGLAAPLARPSRTAFMLVVVLLGATAVILTVGLGGTLTRVVYGLSLARTEQVRVGYIGGQGPGAAGPGGGQGAGITPIRGAGGQPMGILQPMDAATRRVVAAALRAQPGTLHYVAEADEQATVYGVAGQIPVTGYLGNAGWTGYGMISGRWYSGPGQVDVPAYFLAVTGKDDRGHGHDDLRRQADPGTDRGGDLRQPEQRAGDGHRLADPGQRRPRPRGGRVRRRRAPGHVAVRLRAAGSRPRSARDTWRA